MSAHHKPALEKNSVPVYSQNILHTSDFPETAFAFVGAAPRWMLTSSYGHVSVSNSLIPNQQYFYVMVLVGTLVSQVIQLLGCDNFTSVEKILHHPQVLFTPSSCLCPGNHQWYKPQAVKIMPRGSQLIAPLQFDAFHPQRCQMRISPAQ